MGSHASTADSEAQVRQRILGTPSNESLLLLTAHLRNISHTFPFIHIASQAEVSARLEQSCPEPRSLSKEACKQLRFGMQPVQFGISAYVYVCMCARMCGFCVCACVSL